jgi:hypothetical protein
MKSNTLLVVACVLVGLPILSCGGCVALSLIYNLTITDEQRAAMEAKALAEREKFEAELTAQNAKAERDARKTAAKNRAKAQRRTQISASLQADFINLLSNAGVTVVDGVGVDGGSVTIQVTNAWIYEPAGIRKQYAQDIYAAWVSFVKQSELKDEYAGMKIVDRNGNELGGHSLFSGVWVND